MEKRRVVITGMGAVTPIGNNVETFWKNVKEGKNGIGSITKFDTTDYKVKIAAEVKDFSAKELMDFKAAKRMETFSQYAVAAAKEACADAGFNIEEEDPYRCGVIIGSGVGSLQQVEKACQTIETKGPGRVNLLLVPMMISNMAAGNVSIQLGLKGKCTNVVTACATGTNCIGDALRAIQYGDAEVMFAGGTESCICPTAVAGFTALTALTTVQDPDRASIPFDKERGGFGGGRAGTYGSGSRMGTGVGNRGIRQSHKFDVSAFAKKGGDMKKTAPDYEVGDTVKHIKFGTGVVQAIKDGGKDYEVTVDFPKYGPKKMFAGFAKLKKV